MMDFFRRYSRWIIAILILIPIGVSFLIMPVLGYAQKYPGRVVENVSLSEIRSALESPKNRMVVHGEGRPIEAIAFTDQRCPACNELHSYTLFRDATPHVEWSIVPVGILGYKSITQGGSWLRKHYPRQEEVEKRVRLNTTFMVEKMGLKGVPSIFYKDPEGNTRYFSGFHIGKLDYINGLADQYRSSEQEEESENE